ncbi:MAG: DNA (cytosine-5-)-methyltransferase [Clostridiaceae bacterium]|nr:DNA (cytosine-5-)-methyltransferase [Clostridiaceae bacterium]
MLKVVETFSGIGSQAKALSRMGIEYEILNTVEWDISAVYAYDIIHNGEQDLSPYESLSKDELLRILAKYSLSTDGKEPANPAFIRTWPADALRKVLCAINRTKNLGSITDVTADMLPSYIDLLTYSFPCQDLSISGSWHGNMSGIDRHKNNRSGMLWEIERILKELHPSNKTPPKFLLMENVSNILSKPHRKNFAEWEGSLMSLGYVNKVYTLDASNFGSPQKRVRTYMLSVLAPDDERKKIVDIFFSENNLGKQPAMTIKPLADSLRTDYSKTEYKEEADLSNPNDTPSRQKIYADNEIIFDGERTTAVTIKTLTTKQDRNPTSGLLEYPIHAEGKSKYRNFTPRECFLLMGFDENDFSLLKKNNFYIRKGRKLYSREKFEKLAGNSIVVDVLVSIFKQVIELKEMLWASSYLPANKKEHPNNKKQDK